MVAQIAQLPTPPSRSDSPDDFSIKGDAFLAALPNFRTQTNTLANEVEDIGNAADADRIAAASSAAASASSASASASSARQSAASAAESKNFADQSAGAAQIVFSENAIALQVDRSANTEFRDFYNSFSGANKVINLGGLAQSGFEDEQIDATRVSLAGGNFVINLGNL